MRRGGVPLFVLATMLAAVAGTSIKVDDWSDPEIRGKKRNAKDSAKAAEITDKIIQWLDKLGEELKGDVGKAYAAGKKASK